MSCAGWVAIAESYLWQTGKTRKNCTGHIFIFLYLYLSGWDFVPFRLWRRKPMKATWPSRYTRRAIAMKSSAIRELLKVTQRPDMISFAGGMPAPELFPIPEFQRACEKVLAEQGA